MKVLIEVGELVSFIPPSEIKSLDLYCPDCGVKLEIETKTENNKFKLVCPNCKTTIELPYEPIADCPECGKIYELLEVYYNADFVKTRVWCSAMSVVEECNDEPTFVMCPNCDCEVEKLDQ